MAKSDAELAAWLTEVGNPVVRWRTATELLGGAAEAERPRMQQALLAHPDVARWLAVLRGIRRRLHHGQDNALENAGGKLYEFGLRAGLGELDEAMAPWREIESTFRMLKVCKLARD